MFTLHRIVTLKTATLARPSILAVMVQKRPFNEGKRHFKKSKKQKTTAVADGSNEEVLLADIRNLLKNVKISSNDAAAEGEQAKLLPEMHAEIDVTINELSSTGDGLAEKDGQVYVVPFSAPGDVVTARVYKHFDDESYSLADFVKVVQPGKLRTQDPKCPYFTQCSGCQFQHMSYDDQLAHKRTIVEKAYRNFSNLPALAVPKVGDTIGSPLHYGYRTKLTPHFDGPPGGRRDKRQGKQVTWPEVPPIGYMKKGTRKTMDIEDCPIGTDAVRMGMKRERKRVAENIDKYQKGATLLLRENTERLEKQAGMVEQDKDHETKDEVLEGCGSHVHRKTCITDHKQTSTEYVDDYRLDNPAGAFFQNNNSILPVVTQYIREHILDTSTQSDGESGRTPQIKNMIDAYCGSGFFTITLSKMFHNSIGIDISAQSIDFARKNAKLNNLPEDGTHFIAADANALFASVDTKKFPPSETVVVIDPPRKGCDEGFIRQLLEYGPARVCYVSCNVHTQARDVGWLVGGLPGLDGKEGLDGLYEIDTLRGFDFFPQTSHVEGVATLRKKAVASKVEEQASKGDAAAVAKDEA